MTTLTAAKPVLEKRRHPRTLLGLTLDIHLKGHPIGRCRGAIADLSLGGMTFKSDAELEQGMCLHLKLDTALQIRGEIRHIKAAKGDGLHRYGVRFHKIGYGDNESAPAGDFVAARIEKHRAN